MLPRRIHTGNEKRTKRRERVTIYIHKASDSVPHCPHSIATFTLTYAILATFSSLPVFKKFSLMMHNPRPIFNKSYRAKQCDP